MSQQGNDRHMQVKRAQANRFLYHANTLFVRVDERHVVVYESLSTGLECRRFRIGGAESSFFC